MPAPVTFVLKTILKAKQNMLLIPGNRNESVVNRYYPINSSGKSR